MPREQLAATAREWADRVDLVVGSVPGSGLPGSSALAEGGAVLIRPDGYVAWGGHDQAGLSVALRRWFGPPAASVRPRAEAGLLAPPELASPARTH